MNKKFSVSVPLSNAGNVDAAGTLKIDALHHAGRGTTTTTCMYFFTGEPEGRNVKAGKSGKSSLSFSAVPAMYAPAGNYVLDIMVSSSALNAPNATDGTIVALIPLVVC